MGASLEIKEAITKKQGNGDMCYGKFENITSFNNEYYPTSVIQISNASQKDKLHPTQKPVKLLEYLIKTYTNDGETVLDDTMGSGSTGVAALNLHRKFIGIEKDKDILKLLEIGLKIFYKQHTTYSSF